MRGVSSVARSLFEREPTEISVAIASGRSDGQQLHDEAKLTSRGGTWLIEEIRRYDSTGELVSVLLFDHFRAAEGDDSGRLFPRLIDFDVTAAPGGALRSTFSVKELVVNAPIDSAVFDLRGEEPKAIWDSDSEIFLR